MCASFRFLLVRGGGAIGSLLFVGALLLPATARPDPVPHEQAPASHPSAKGEDASKRPAERPSSKTPAAAAPASHGERSGSGETKRLPVFYETATVTARPVSSASGAVTVVDSKEIEAAGDRSGAEILDDVPGLDVLASGGRAGFGHAWIRGGDPNFTLVLLDGVPLNDSTDLQGGAVNLEELPADLVERAEVVRGPQTAFYGMSGLSGVVQLFTPRGQPGPVRASGIVEAGDADLRHGSAHASGMAGRAGWSAGVAYDEERHRVALDRFRQLDAWGSTDLAFGAASELALTVRAATGTGDDYPDGSGGPVHGSGETRHNDHDDLTLGGRLLLGPPGGGGQQVTVGFARRTLDQTSPPVPPLVPRSQAHTTFDRLRLAWQVPVLHSRRTLVDGGASADGEWARNSSLLELPPELGGSVRGDYRDTRWSGGVFGVVRQRRGAVLLEAALRADAASGDTVQLHPHLGVVWTLGAGSTRIRASGGRASKLPSFFALSSPRALGGNPNLRPERTVGGEVGVEHRLRGTRLEAGATFFFHEYRDLVDFDYDRFQNVNRAKVRSHGVELTLRWQALPSLSLEGEATWLEARDLSGGGPLLFEPRWSGGGRLTWRPDDRLSLRLFTQARSPYLDHQLPVPERDTVAGYGILGFAGSWRVRKAWSLRARLDNLTDHRYDTLIGFPAPGRSVWVGLGWDRR
jgi:vitamin B12 transporter